MIRWWGTYYLLVVTQLIICTAVFAQETPATLPELVAEGEDVYKAFRTLGALGGVAALLNLLVNVTKFGPLAEFIKEKKLRWIRPVLALVAGTFAGFVAGLSKGDGILPAILYAFGGLFAGGGAVALHELIAVLQGKRK